MKLNEMIIHFGLTNITKKNNIDEYVVNNTVNIDYTEIKIIK